MTIRMEPVESSSLKAVGYCPANQVLRVEFKNNRAYRYSDVPEAVWEEFQSADSLGTFLNQRIKPTYSVEAD